MSALKSYLGKSPFGKMDVKEPFESRIKSGNKADLFRALVLKDREAMSADLEAMLSLAPFCFTEIENFLIGLRKSGNSVIREEVNQVRKALAISVQEYLFSEYRRFNSFRREALVLRKFLFELKDLWWRANLFGFWEEELQVLQAAAKSLRIDKKRQQVRERVRAHRRRQKTKFSE
jgi:hypothetical protein